jgi:hypothetical protein
MHKEIFAAAGQNILVVLRECSVADLHVPTISQHITTVVTAQATTNELRARTGENSVLSAELAPMSVTMIVDIA